MERAVVAAGAAAMGIKLSADSTPGQLPGGQTDTPAERLRAGFLLILGGLVVVLKRAVLPHLLLAFGLWLINGVAWYSVTVAGTVLPAPLGWSILLAALLVGAVAALGYAFLTALFYSLKSAAAYAEDFFYELFEAIKDKIRAQINTLEDGVAKQQAKVMLDNSVREVLSPLKNLRVGSVPAALLTVVLGIMTFVSRSVFVARLARVSGKTVHFSTIFASRATLVGALFLNMRWLAALLLWVMYAIGLLVFILDIWVIL